MRQINRQMKKATDAQEINYLASAWAKLADKWREFNDIPLPGSRRPKEKRTPPPAELPEPE
jgi:hypothetical protein